MITPTGSPADDPGVTALWFVGDGVADVGCVAVLNAAGPFKRPRKNFSIIPRWPAACGLRHVAGVGATPLVAVDP